MKMNIILLTIILVPVSLYFYLYNPIPNKVNNQEVLPKTSKEIQKKSYSEVKDSIEKTRKEIALKYLAATPKIKKKEVLKIAKDHFINSVTQCLYPYWEGTPWEFYGTTQTPNQGSIACGYFVTTLLDHAGVKLDRVGLAEIASETMIRKLVSKGQIKVYRNLDFNKFLPAFKSQGAGLYIVGLDFHTGFILVEKEEVYFIHSSGISPLCVIKEKANESPLLTCSKYRVTGKISDDDFFLEKWLTGKAF